MNELGKDQNANTLKQTMTTIAADVDPADGKIHVRFALAPVLQNPTHVDTHQPYFFVELKNDTKDAGLFTTFNFANQPAFLGKPTTRVRWFNTPTGSRSISRRAAAH